MKKYLILIQAFLFLSAASANEYLCTKGKRILDEKGTRVILRGVNLGGWLVEEAWMMPFVKKPPTNSTLEPIVDHVSLWSVIEKRFGYASMLALRTAYREAWLQDADFDRIKALGFNSVRLPFLSDIADEPGGLFTWLDQVIASCKQRGLYVILDMHGAFGRQSAEHHTGHAGQNRFFADDANIQKAATLWKDIAERYKDEPVVAGYDLLNEPAGAQSTEKLYQVYDILYKAVRSKDTRHLIFIEDGFTGLVYMPKPVGYGWKGVVYSTHMYPHENSFADTIQKAVALRIECAVPFYFGEFNVAPQGSLEELAAVIGLLDANKMSYAFWCYKTYHQSKRLSLWALYQSSRRIKKIDPYRDSLKDMRKKIAKLGTDNFVQHELLQNVFVKKV